MLKSKIERFVAKNAVICFLLLSIIDVVALKSKWFVLAGLFAGTIMSMAKFASYAWIFGKILGTGGSDSSVKQSPGSSVAVFAVNQIVLLPLLFISYNIDQWLFAGFVAGVLTVPFVIMISSITVTLGITKTILSKKVNIMHSGDVMKPNDLFSINVFGLVFPISDSIVMMWIIMAVLIILAFIFARNLKTIPKGRQNVTEIIVETINNLIKGNIGHHWKPFAPYFGTILLFLVLSNTAGIFNIFPSGEQLYKWTGIEFFEKLSHFSITPPTKDLNVTVTMALMTVSLILFSGIKYKGIRGWLASFLKPSPVMLPFHILDYGTRTLSLSLRLFGNILAGYIIVEMVYEASIFLKPVLPVASGFFDLFDAGLQAYIFVFLSSIYISEAIE